MTVVSQFGEVIPNTKQWEQDQRNTSVEPLIPRDPFQELLPPVAIERIVHSEEVSATIGNTATVGYLARV